MVAPRPRRRSRCRRRSRRGYRPITRGARLRALPGAAVDALVRAAGPESRSELLVVELARTGGAWTVVATGPGRDPEQAERVHIALERLDRALAAWR